ncbi:hypothetical protein ACWGA0_30780 [Streptomyces erythrochromogenes]
MAHGSIAYTLARRTGAPAFLAASGEAARTVYSWDHESGVSAGALAAPLARLGTAVAPLLRREDLGPAVNAVFTAAAEHHGDDDRLAEALRTFHQALRTALEAPAPTRRRWWPLGRAGRQTLPRG